MRFLIGLIVGLKGHGTTVSVLIPPERLVKHADRLSGRTACIA